MRQHVLLLMTNFVITLLKFTAEPRDGATLTMLWRNLLSTRVQTHIGVRALLDLRGRWLSCPKNLRNSRMRDCWKRDTNVLKLHVKQTRSQFTVWREIFRGSLISRILDFLGFAGKKSAAPLPVRTPMQTHKNWRQIGFYNKTPKWSNAGNKWGKKTPLTCRKQR